MEKLTDDELWYLVRNDPELNRKWCKVQADFLDSIRERVEYRNRERVESKPANNLGEFDTEAEAWGSVCGKR